MKIVTISSKRQVTIPKSFLEVLGLESYGKAILEKEKDKVVIKAMKKSVVDQVGGSLRKYVPKSKLGIPFSKVRQKTQKEVAKYLATKK